MTYEADITIMGAGIVGLTIAAEVAREDKQVYVLQLCRREGIARKIKMRANYLSQLMLVKWNGYGLCG